MQSHSNELASWGGHLLESYGNKGRIVTSNHIHISFIGFGEAAQAFVRGFQQEDIAPSLCAYDIKTDGAEADNKRSDYAACAVTGERQISAACAKAGIIFSLVTAQNAEGAAAKAAESDLNNALFLDCNSCAPETKRRSAQKITDAGGRYVDVAIMTPVHPKLHKSPCLLAGPHAQDASEAMQALGMQTQIAGEAIGDASTKKMIRSVMIKGLEALTIECFLAARAAGIEDDILASLEGSFPGFDWKARAPYMFERVATHGIRRASEMEEVVQTLNDLGIAPHVTQGTVKRQREVGALGINSAEFAADDLAGLADAIRAGLDRKDI